jgi:hypothetical protein
MPCNRSSQLEAGIQLPNSSSCNLAAIWLEHLSCSRFDATPSVNAILLDTIKRISLLAMVLLKPLKQRDENHAMQIQRRHSIALELCRARRSASINSPAFNFQFSCYAGSQAASVVEF